MKLSTYFLLFILLHSAFSASAALEDSVSVNFPVPTVVRYVHSGINLEGNQKWIVPDSGLIKLSSVNIATRDHYNSLGSLGSALKPQLFSVEKGILPYAGIRSYDPYILRSDSLRYYRTNKRFSQLDYHNGSFKEQEIRVFHSQNILKTWSAGLEFHRMGVRDFTRNSDIYQNQLALFTWYESPNGRYNLFLSALWNTFKNQVNGGLKSDSLFDLGTIDNIGLKGINIKLADAAHQFRNHAFTMHNSYDFIHRQDSGSYRKQKVNSFQFVQSTSFESGSYAYSDAVTDSNFYDHFYNNTTTYDSLHYYNLKNSAGFLLPQSDSSSSFFFKNFSSLIEIENQWFQFNQRDDLYLNNYSLKASLFSPVNDSTFSIQTAADYIFAGEYRGLYKVDARIVSPEYKAGSLFAVVSVLRRKSDLLYQRYYSNHFVWNNSFKDIHSQSIRAGINNTPFQFRLEIILHRIQNFVYVGSSAIPIQFDASFEVTQLRLLKNFKFRKWHFDNEIYYQKSGNEQVLRLPDITGTHSFYLENTFFKKALKAQFGLQLHFNSTYYADGYMPATAFFYTQNEKKTGGYALIDLFVHLKVKTARVFLKIENIADGIVADRYYLTPEYPQPGRTIKFGISWRFFDM